MAKNTENKKGKPIAGITPSFTADRFLVYGLGIAACGAGIYVISRFVKSGLDNMDGKGKKDDEKKPDDGKTGGVLVFDSNIGTPTYFPIQATSLNFPTYDRSVQILQTAMLQAFGNVLPVHGADGKFGFETRAAVIAYVNPQGIVTKSDWDSLMLRLKQLTTQAQQRTEEAKIIQIPAAESTQSAPASGKIDMRIKQPYDLPRKELDFQMEQGDPALMGTNTNKPFTFPLF